MSATERQALESIVDRANEAYTRARAAMLELRRDELLTPESTNYVLHIERELTEAMIRLDSARFASEALLAKFQREEKR